MCGENVYFDPEDLRKMVDAFGGSNDFGLQQLSSRSGPGPHSVTFDGISRSDLSFTENPRGVFDSWVQGSSKDLKSLRRTYVISASLYDDIVSRGESVDDFVRADPVWKVQPSAASPTMLRGRRSGGNHDDRQGSACEWDTDGDGDCAFHSDCRTRTHRHG